jgi:N-acetyllactosaminide beta-1,3-N-acetylglucosaminyltransferase
MWKIHCMTVVFLIGINFYLLVKLLHCAEKTSDHNRTSSSTEGSPASSSLFGWQYAGQQRHPLLDVQVRGLWKGLQLPVQHRTEQGSSGGARSPARSGREEDKAAETEAAMADSSTFDLLMPLGRWDDSRSFVVRDFAVTGKQFHSTAVSHNVCLATQSSLDRLHWLGESSDHWRGAISLAIYLDDEEVGLFYKVLTHMRRCHSDLLANIAFHVVSAAGQSLTLPAAFSATFASSASSSSSSSSSSGGDSSKTETDDGDEGTSASAGHQSTPVNCTGPSEALTWLLKERPSLSAKWESGRPYPQNLMRNVARKGCPSHYVLLLDVDVIPSYNMAESLAEFLDRPSVVAHCTKCAFVVPTYELDYSADFPQNKSQLLTLENQGRAQPFHHKAFRYNQFASNLTR